MSNKMYVLMGSCGDYSDRTDWVVAVYQNKEAADQAQAEAVYQAADYSKVGRRFAEENEDGDSFDYPWTDTAKAAEKEARETILKVDPSAQFDYTGTTYWVVEADLR